MSYGQLLAWKRLAASSPVTGAGRVPVLWIDDVRVVPGNTYVIKTSVLDAQSQVAGDLMAVSIRHVVGRVARALSPVLSQSLLLCGHYHPDYPSGPLFAFVTPDEYGVLSVALCVERYMGTGNVWLGASERYPIELEVYDCTQMLSTPPGEQSHLSVAADLCAKYDEDQRLFIASELVKSCGLQWLHTGTPPGGST